MDGCWRSCTRATYPLSSGTFIAWPNLNPTYLSPAKPPSTPIQFWYRSDWKSRRQTRPLPRDRFIRLPPRSKPLTSTSVSDHPITVNAVTTGGGAPSAAPLKQKRERVLVSTSSLTLHQDFTRLLSDPEIAHSLDSNAATMDNSLLSLEIEKAILNLTSTPVCLDPDPTLAMAANWALGRPKWKEEARAEGEQTGGRAKAKKRRRMEEAERRAEKRRGGEDGEEEEETKKKKKKKNGEEEEDSKSSCLPSLSIRPSLFPPHALHPSDASLPLVDFRFLKHYILLSLLPAPLLSLIATLSSPSNGLQS
ncbi:hypothetical protein BT69DRAFT_1354617 [Atractiella rhizophila]|nr:hypothetical protein BT69DRAFT_1354617 [Atractiella rhizophila]